MGWRTALRLSSVAYRELTFQAIYATRQGHALPAGPPADLKRVTARRVRESKLLVSALLAGMAAVAAMALGTRFQLLLGPEVAPPLYRAAVLAAVLLLELSLLWTTGLQILPTYLGSRILPLFATLPIAPSDRDRAAFLLFLRLFDLPALTVLVLMPLFTGLAFGSVWAGLALVPGVVAIELVAFALALATGDHFVRRVQGSPTGHRASAVRWLFLLLWAMPAFAIYAFVSFSPELLRGIAALASADPAGLTALLLVFPFPYALLPSLAAPASGSLGLGSGPAAGELLALATVAYAVPLAFLGRWLLHAPGRLALSGSDSFAPRYRNRRLAVVRPSLSVVVKDLRIASRSPAFGYVVLLPILDAMVLGISTFVGTPAPLTVYRLGAAAVATSALLATFFGPAFFATELMGSSYVRTLPLSPRTLVLGKATLIVSIYAASALVVVAFTLARVFSPGILLLFVLSELPALLAAGLFEMALLHTISAGRDLGLTNLYTGAWWATAAAIPGLALAGGPLLLYELEPVRLTGVVLMALAALGELGAVVPLALFWTRRWRA
ncbi:MAG: hypothetical protein ACYDFT_01595 [Thermoplasmata archaeon]